MLMLEMALVHCQNFTICLLRYVAGIVLHHCLTSHQGTVLHFQKPSLVQFAKWLLFYSVLSSGMAHRQLWVHGISSKPHKDLTEGPI
jgi:hypothetical protein